jgi:hypothetical protein
MFFLLQNWRTGGGGRMDWGEVALTVYTHVSKCKMIHVETVGGLREGGMKESSGESEFKYDIFDTL